MWVEDDPTSGKIGHFRPDPRHPMHPYNVEQRRRPKLREWLEQDEGYQAFVAQWKPIAHNGLNELRARVLATTRDPALPATANRFLRTIMDAIAKASKEAGPDDVTEWVKEHYLTERVIPPEYLAKYLTIQDPINLILTLDGTITALFKGASPNERADYEPLIRSAQEAFGHRKNSGGRPSRKDDPVKAEQAQLVAKLYHWLAYSQQEIAVLMGWPWSGEQSRDRVRLSLRDGEAILSDKLGPDWATEPPKGLPSRN